MSQRFKVPVTELTYKGTLFFKSLFFFNYSFDCWVFSLRWLLLLWSAGSRALGLWHVGLVDAAHGLYSTGSVVVAHGLSCSVVCGIFLDPGLNVRLLHWQADSLPLSHRGSPRRHFVFFVFFFFEDHIFIQAGPLVLAPAQGDILNTKSQSEVAQSCPTLCDPMDCSLPGSSIHGIFQARVLESVAISFSRVSFQPRDRTQVSRTAGRRVTV